MRIWCSWCSIADFSSACTGSSPVIRYLDVYSTDFWRDAWTYYAMTFNYSCRRCDDLFLRKAGRNVLKEFSSRCSFMMNKADASIVVIWMNSDMMTSHVWNSLIIRSNGCKYSRILKRGSLKQNVWGDGRAVNCIRL